MEEPVSLSADRFFCLQLFSKKDLSGIIFRFIQDLLKIMIRH